MFQTYYKSEIGWIEIKGNEDAIISVLFVDAPNKEEINPVLESCKQQVQEYFEGTRRTFTVPLSAKGTEFQTGVWDALKTIPYGETASYSDIATKIGNPKAVRAIGNANSKNPISILVPCHRIIGKNRALVGYAGGLWRKKWLLTHEQKKQGN
ncbi:methylated-DNA--[protein]-cysteine S-methyltransferase [Ectobacillus sp. sgz5001026]|uniref:methylated-DNA--[protein]-cysteine S-methyltransferase n=1 Tax=Ectobacillus sp. sgz5001026 TaxID=3242473 RepID=UPI0036D42E4D